MLACSLLACSDGAGLERTHTWDVWLETWVGFDATTAGTDAPVHDQLEPDPDASIVGGACGDALRVLRVEAWPGGGIGVAVELHIKDTVVDAGHATATLDGRPATIARAPETLGVTGLVLTDAARRDAALTFIDALPDGETLVVWAGSRLVAEATTDKVHARARLAAADIVGAPDWSALRAAVAALGGPNGALAKTLVVAGEAPTLIAGPVLVAGLEADRVGELVTDLVTRRASFARVGACPVAGVGARVELVVDGVTCDVVVPAPEGSVAAIACDPEAIASDAWPYGTRVDIVMDEAETAVWEARKDAKSKEDFTAQVRLGPAAPLPATLHFRGQTSMDCVRKSYDVDFSGPTPRRLMPGVASDELFLISMCKDDGHYNQILGDRLAAEVGVFPLGFRVVHLFVNDLDQGLYLMLEQPIEGLRADTTALAAVIRRRLDQDGNPPDVEHSINDDAWALAAYDTMVASAGEGADALARHLDVDGYLRWMALAVMLHNGDYVDEVLFHGALEVDPTSGPAHPWFRVMGWDPDDLWSPCHRNGVAAIPDPNGLLFCAEANIDHVVFANPHLYARFVDHLEALLIAWPMERMAAEMAAVRDMLFPLMTSDATALAMPELHAGYPESVTAAGWKTTVEGKMNRDLDRHAEWRTELLDKIAAYRAAPRLSAPAAVPGHLVAVRVDVADPTRASVTIDGHVVPLHRGRGVLTVLPEAAPSVASRPLDAADVIIEGERLVAAGETLTIPAGARVVLGADARLVVYGTLVAAGTIEAPILFTPADASRPWAAVDVRAGGRADLAYTWLVGGGADHDRFAGHSGSDPVIAVVDGALTLRGGGIVDGPGKAIYSERADVVLDDVTIARVDTGGEHVESTTTQRGLWVFEIPDADGRYDDDDNDAMYLRLGSHVVEDLVLSFGEDDGIDHNGADLTLRRAWIDGFRHEGVATSDQGTVTIEDAVVRACDQGIEVGYGAPDVTVRGAWITDCGVGLRWGDDYTWDATGRLAVERSVVLHNERNVKTDDPQQGEAPADRVTISCSAVDTAAWDARDGNVAGAPPAVDLCPPAITTCDSAIGPASCP